MKNDVTAIIKRELAAGKSAPEIREVLSTYGEELDDHYDLYFELQKEVESAPSQAMTQRDSFGGSGADMMTVRSPRTSPISLLIKLCVVLAILGGMAVIALGEGNTVLKLMGIGESEVIDGVSTQDIQHQTSMKAMASSARIYKNRLLDYGGMCSSIGIDFSVYRCNEDLKSFAIETQLSTGEYYCVDSTEFEGITSRSFGSGTVCPQ